MAASSLVNGDGKDSAVVEKRVEAIVPRLATQEEAMERPAELLAAAAARAVNGWQRMRAIAGKRDG